MELFYYTTTGTMRFVLEKGDIFATNIHYMNDAEEYINGLDELYRLANERISVVEKWVQSRKDDKNLLGKIRNLFSYVNLKENKQSTEYYSISFCKKNDLLSQWAIYARESGVSICMNFEKDSYKFQTESNDEGGEAEWNLCPQAVQYFTYSAMQENEYEKAAFDILNQLYDKAVPDQEELKIDRWRYISTLIKRYEFYQEQESRLVFDPTLTLYAPKVQYREDKKVLKPYLDIKCENGWPIWKIMVGPGFNQQIVYDSVEHFLNHSNVKVGICSGKDYAKRLKSYLDEASKYDDLSQCGIYVEIIKQIQKMENATVEDEEERDSVEMFLNQKMIELSRYVCDGTYKEKIKQYFKDYHFTQSGVVLVKSSIPYIF